MMGGARLVNLGARALAVHQLDGLLLPLVTDSAALEANLMLDGVDIFLRQSSHLPEMEDADLVQLLGNAGAKCR